MKEFVFSLDISAENYLRYYQGRAVSVLAIDHHGRRIRFPAGALRPFVLNNGIHGTFRLVTDEQFRLQRLERVET